MSLRPCPAVHAAAALSAALGLFVAPAAAQQGVRQAARAPLALSVGEAELITLDAPAATVFIAHPDVADIQIAGPRSVFVFGQSAGRTTLFALDEAGAPLAVRDVRVEPELSQLRALLAARFPDAPVRLTAAPGSLMLEGSAATAQEAEAILDTVAGAAGEGLRVVNRMTVEAATQVNLRVRVAEVSRDLDRRLGINWQGVLNVGSVTFGLATGTGVTGVLGATAGSFAAASAGVSRGDLDLNALIDALDREGLARTLAEPNLTAVSGETASFTAGGEFPIPVAQDGDTTTIEFKSFGVILDFTPVVLSPDRISLRVRPEVSDITANGAIQTDGFEIPALTVRRVETTVELASGQSLVIGGLLRQTARDVVDKVPGLGDVPVLGALFTSSRYQNAETELIVTVTPYVVRPVRPDALPTPVGALETGHTLESLLARRSSAAAPPRRLHGQVGFVF